MSSLTTIVEQTTASVVVPSTSLPPATGGSGYGVSYYRRAALCTRAFHLDRQMEAEGLKLEMGDRANVGVYFHSMAEAYYAGKEYVQEVSDIGNLVSEANGLWSAYYRAHPGQDWFGQVIGVEEQLSATIKEGVPLSGRADLVIRTTQDSVLRLDGVGAYGTEPGQTWLVDHKTKGRKDSDYQLKFFYSPQFILYNWLYEQQTGVKPSGTIVNIIFTTKTPSFEKLIVPAPTEYQVRGVLAWLETTAQRVAVDNSPNYAACDLYGVCGHLKSGRCNRQ